MPDHSGLAAGIVALLGEPESAPVVFRVGGRLIDGEAAFQVPYTHDALGGVPVSRAAPLLMVRGADWDAYGAHVGDYVTVHGREYAIVSATRDESDLVEAALRESR